MSGRVEAVAPVGGPSPRRGLLRGRLRTADVAIQTVALWAFLAILVAVFGSLSDAFFTSTNAINILANVAVIGIVSIGQTFVIVSGGFDLSVSGTIPLSAVLYAQLVNAGVPPVPAIVLVLLVGAVVGVVNGAAITRLRINPLITTLATLSITEGLALTISQGLTEPIVDVSAGFLAEQSVGEIPNQVWALLVLALLAHFVLRRTVLGRSVYALGGNREAAWLSGMRVDALTVAMYVVCGALASFAGVILASQLLAGSGTLGQEAALQSVSAVILGGASLAGGEGGVIGTMMGVLILGTLANGLALLHVSSFYQQIATGVVLLLAVALSRARTTLARRPPVLPPDSGGPAAGDADREDAMRAPT